MPPKNKKKEATKMLWRLFLASFIAFVIAYLAVTLERKFRYGNNVATAEDVQRSAFGRFFRKRVAVFKTGDGIWMKAIFLGGFVGLLWFLCGLMQTSFGLIGLVVLIPSLIFMLLFFAYLAFWWHRGGNTFKEVIIASLIALMCFSVMRPMTERVAVLLPRGAFRSLVRILPVMHLIGIVGFFIVDALLDRYRKSRRVPPIVWAGIVGTVVTLLLTILLVSCFFGSSLGFMDRIRSEAEVVRGKVSTVWNGLWGKLGQIDTETVEVTVAPTQAPKAPKPTPQASPSVAPGKSFSIVFKTPIKTNLGQLRTFEYHGGYIKDVESWVKLQRGKEIGDEGAYGSALEGKTLLERVEKWLLGLTHSPEEIIRLRSQMDLEEYPNNEAENKAANELREKGKDEYDYVVNETLFVFFEKLDGGKIILSNGYGLQNYMKGEKDDPENPSTQGRLHYDDHDLVTFEDKDGNNFVSSVQGRRNTGENVPGSDKYSREAWTNLGNRTWVHKVGSSAEAPKPTPTPTPNPTKNPNVGHTPGEKEDLGPGPDTNSGVGSQTSSEDKPGNSGSVDYDGYRQRMEENEGKISGQPAGAAPTGEPTPAPAHVVDPETGEQQPIPTAIIGHWGGPTG